MSEFSAVCFSREDAHEAAQRAYDHAKELLAAGERALIVCKPALEPISVKQRRFFHGPVLEQISEQAKVDGVRYTTDLWKEHFRRMFLPDTFEVVRLPGRKRATPRRIRSSTEELGVRGYAEHIEKVIQYAVTELGVEFVFTNEEQTLLAKKPQRRNAP